MTRKTEKRFFTFFALHAALALCLCASLLALSPAPAQASARISIAATVNDDVITKEDVDSRLALYLAGKQGTPPPAVRVQLEKQVLDKLIDEKLELQEAQKLGIVVSQQDLDGGFAEIAKQNNLSPDVFKSKLAAAGVDASTLLDQIKAELAWSQVVRRKLGPQVSVSQSDINSAVDLLKRNAGKPVYQVAEILLTVPSAGQDAEVRRSAERLEEQITHGAPFSAVARQFSQAPGASTGGDLGWVQQGQLDPKLDAALQKLHPGQLSPPIRTDKGYHILFLRNERVVGAENEKSASPNEQPAQDTAAPAADAQATAAADASAQPPETQDEKTRESLANQIGLHRLGQMQAQYLSDLRASAFIDKRM